MQKCEECDQKTKRINDLERLLHRMAQSADDLLKEDSRRSVPRQLSLQLPRQLRRLAMAR